MTSQVLLVKEVMGLDRQIQTLILSKESESSSHPEDDTRQRWPKNVPAY
jgi:hypothetical protein